MAGPHLKLGGPSREPGHTPVTDLSMTFHSIGAAKSTFKL
jgi:hypothetical protein